MIAVGGCFPHKFSDFTTLTPRAGPELTPRDGTHPQVIQHGVTPGDAPQVGPAGPRRLAVSGPPAEPHPVGHVLRDVMGAGPAPGGSPRPAGDDGSHPDCGVGQAS